MTEVKELSKTTGAEIYPASISQAQGATYFLARRGGKKVVGCVGSQCILEAQKAGELDGKCVCLGPLSHANAQHIRTALPWTAPRTLGLATSIGFGDRLGLATPGHVRAVRGSGLAPVFAQQSIRELARTQRTPEQVMDAATFGVLQEGWREGFGSDADHLQKPQDIDLTAAAGFTMFTIDPGAYVVNAADAMSPAELLAAYGRLDFDSLRITLGELKLMYVFKDFPLADGSKIVFDEPAFLRAAVKYGNAIAHTAGMYRRLKAVAGGPCELEVSVDETDSPTTPAEHYFFASELRRLGVEWVSMAPRFIGRFEKGVDYIGDLAEFRRSFAQHVAVMRTLGPYKMSIHSGSDKFSIYPIVRELAGDLVHLKTAGTSYLEALRAIAQIDRGLFRQIYDFARGRYETDKASYHVSAELAKAPPAQAMEDRDLPALLDQFDARQVFHVTFGSVLTADGGEKFKKRLCEALEGSEEIYYQALEKHLGRHVRPFSRA